MNYISYYKDNKSYLYSDLELKVVNYAGMNKMNELFKAEI